MPDPNSDQYVDGDYLSDRIVRDQVCASNMDMVTSQYLSIQTEPSASPSRQFLGNSSRTRSGRTTNP